MQTHLSWRRAAAAGATGWLLLNLLAACGGAAQPVSNKNGATKPASTTPPTEVAQATQAPITATVAGTAQVTSTQPATCSAVEIPNDAQTPPASAQDWSLGPENAPLTIIEYADFQCPGCSGVAPMLDQIRKENSDNIRLIYRHFPLLTIHDKAKITAEAAEAAGAQGKFWEMHDIMFEQQSNWASTPASGMIDVLVGYAKEIGLADVDKFRTDLEKETYAAKVQAAYQQAVDAKLSGTPTVIVNQVMFPSQQFGLSYQGFDAFIKLMQLKEKWYTEPAQVIDPAKKYTATIKTEKGDIEIELFTETAPVNVNNFVFLAQKGWYKNTTFHRVLEGFVAQGGDPTGTGVGFPGYRCGDELTPAHKFDGPGVFSLANSGPNTNGSQFFITFASLPQLDANFTIIGRVVNGLDVAKKLTVRDPQTNMNPPAGDKVLDVVINEKG